MHLVVTLTFKNPTVDPVLAWKSSLNVPLLQTILLSDGRCRYSISGPANSNFKKCAITICSRLSHLTGWTWAAFPSPFFTVPNKVIKIIFYQDRFHYDFPLNVDENHHGSLMVCSQFALDNVLYFWTQVWICTFYTLFDEYLVLL